MTSDSSPHPSSGASRSAQTSSDSPGAPADDDRSGLSVVKIGGTLIEEVGRSDAFWSELRQLGSNGPVVLVHGGGAQATRMARRLDHEPEIVEGRRITSDLDLEIVLWTMCGELNTRLVAQARRHGLDPVGLNGADGSIIQVEKRPPWTIESREVDFGWVGDVRAVRTELIDDLLAGGYFPILAPLGIDEEGRLFNVNADTVACRLARAVGAREFLLLTGSGGVQRDLDDPDSRLATCTRARFREGLEEGWIRDGMKVKLTTAFEALDGGVEEVYVCAPDDLAERARGTRIAP